MVDQYSKFLKQSEAIEWRKQVPSMNFILTSTSWRQDHNGFSHQNPGFVSSVLNDYNEMVRVYYPPDVNTTLATMEQCFSSHNKINVIVAGKRPVKQYLNLKQARRQVAMGIEIWDEYGHDGDNADIVFAATGDYITQETTAAIRVLAKLMPGVKSRFVSLTELTCCINKDCKICRLGMQKFNEIFTEEKPIIYAYHGYPVDIQSLFFGHPSADRVSIFGYKENGTTTTPFDMLVQNKIDRFSLAKHALNVVKLPTEMEAEKETAIKYCESILQKHSKFTRENGMDIEEVREFDKFF